MSFVPELSSYCFQAISLAWFSRQSNTYAPLVPDYTICDLKSRTKFVFSLHDTRICTRTRTLLGMKTGMTCTGTKWSFGIMQTNAEKYMEME